MKLQTGIAPQRSLMFNNFCVNRSTINHVDPKDGYLRPFKEVGGYLLGLGLRRGLTLTNPQKWEFDNSDQRFPVPVFSVPIPALRLLSLRTRFRFRFRVCACLVHDSGSGSET